MISLGIVVLVVPGWIVPRAGDDSGQAGRCIPYGKVMFFWILLVPSDFCSGDCLGFFSGDSWFQVVLFVFCSILTWFGGLCVSILGRFTRRKILTCQDASGTFQLQQCGRGNDFEAQPI